MRRLINLLLILSIVPSVHADDAAVRKYRDYTPLQISSLSEEERRSKVPMMYSMAARRGLSVGSELLFGMELNLLMYPGLHDYASAVKAFQEDLGDKPTGQVTVWQIHQLQQRAEMQKLSRIGFPSQFFSDISRDYASVLGTMIIVDEQIYGPINHVRVACDRQAGTCEMDRLSLALPREDSWSQTYQVLEESEETYVISRWATDSIESHPLGTSTGCRETSLTFNFKTKEFYFITRNAGGDCKLPLGGEFDKLKRPRVSQIVDGEKIFGEKFSEIEKKAYDVLSSSFRKRVELLGKEK